MMIVRFATALLLGLALAPAAPVAGQEDEPVVIGTATTLSSEILDEDRRLLIYLPYGYEQSTERYPVLYLLDGPAHFHHVTATAASLARADRIPPMIVVGIANTDRDRDLKPAANVTRFTEELPHFETTVTIDYPSAGGADRFLRFLAEELAPHIDGRYRTADFRLLVGHSSGGLFTLHALLSRPEAFNAFIASSPSLWWDEEALVKRAVGGALPEFGPRPRFLYMGMGDEGASMIGPVSDLATALELAGPADLRWWYRLMPAESHVSMPHRTIYDGLETIFSHYAIPESMMMGGDVARLERHLAGASARYGYDIQPPEWLVNQMGYMQLRLFDRPEKAVEIFRRNLELYQESPNAYDSLADALEAVGRLDEAREYREHATAARSPSAANLLQRGDSLMEVGYFDEAIDLYQRAALLPPVGGGADGRLFHAYLALGLVDRAAAMLHRSRERGDPAPYQGWWHCRRALVAIFRGDSDALALQTDSLLSIASEAEPEAWECAAFNEVFLRRYDDARAHLERYVHLARPDELPVNLGFLHLLRGATAEGERILEEAEARARAALASDPDSWEPHFELAELASMRRRTDTALRHLEFAVERGLGREWWAFHLFSGDALPDPVFEPLYGHPEFVRLRADILSHRTVMRRRIRGDGE